MAPIDDITKRLRQVLTDAFGDIRKSLADMLDTAAKDGGSNMLNDIGSAVDIVHGLLGVGEAIIGILDPAVGAIEMIDKAAGKQGRGFGIGYALGYALWSQIEPVIEPLTHEIAHLTENEIFDPDTAAQLVARGFITDEFGGSEASGGGFDGGHFGAMVKLAKTYVDAVPLMELRRRGLINDNTFTSSLQQLGYGPDERDKLTRLLPNLLSVADLALAELRGIMPSDDATAYAARLGFSADDFTTLIGNTGEPPGLMQMLEAYRRGFIDQPTLEIGIRQSRVRDQWIPMIERLRYTPMSTSDAVRAVVENYMTPDQGAAISQQNGLEPDHWHYLYESWGRPFAHGEMVKLYHLGLASLDQVNQAMRESDIKDKYIPLAVPTARRLLPERMIVQAIQHDSLSLEDGATKLLQEGYTPDDAKVLLNLGLAMRTTTSKLLPRSEITELYSQQLISQGDAETHLQALGMSAEDAALLIHLQDVKDAAAQIRTQENYLRSEYIAGALTDTDARTNLLNLGLTAAQVDHLMSIWQREQRRPSRALTEAQIVKAAKENIMRGVDAYQALVSIGYTADAAKVLLLSNGIDPTSTIYG